MPRPAAPYRVWCVNRSRSLIVATTSDLRAPFFSDRETATIGCAKTSLDGANATLDCAHGIDDRAVAMLDSAPRTFDRADTLTTARRR